MKHIFFILILLFPIISYAENYEPKEISEIRAQYNLLVDLKNDKEISETVFAEKTDFLKKLSSEKFHIDMDGLELQQIVPLQKMNWIGTTLYVLSAFLFILILFPLIYKLKTPLLAILDTVVSIVKFFINNRLFKAIARQLVIFIKRFWEVLVYSALAVFLYFFNNEYIVLLISFMLGSLVSFSLFSRAPESKRKIRSRETSFILLFLWGGIAYFYSNSFVGFLAVGAFVTAIGFVLEMSPGIIMIGLKDSKKGFVFRITGITFFLSLLAWLIFYTSYFPVLAPVRDAMYVFKVGMVSLIPMVYFIGISYTAFFLYRDNLILKLICEIAALVSSVSILLISLLYGINSMFWIGLFFMSWYVVDKFYELVYKKLDLVWAGLILTIILGGVGYLIKTNIPTIMTTLESLNL